MELTTAFDPTKFVPAERRLPSLPDSEDHGASLTAEAANDLARSPHLVATAADPALDEDQLLALIEMQYEEYTARRALEELFESGDLAALSG
ncbi:MAG: hypothetical protein E6K49_12290 [Gammaproteobacteria bacterium]|nr:MAG: hypothetical protein E6K52_14560 [Gammaproteobacteria bacterium]TLY75480.1 MAG: hypothetical protein E6K49_12290 [Gammaproteobacteria bacterium]